MSKPFNKWIVIRALFLTVFVWSLPTGVNTGSEDTNRGEMEAEKGHRLSEATLRSEASAALPSNTAAMKLDNKRHNGFRGAAPKRAAQLSQQALSTVVEELKERIALPFDIQVVFKECGRIDSYYDDHRHEIVICDELIDAYFDLFSGTLKTRTARDEAAKGAIVSMFLHEVGHALIDGWDLPITGREEDAADQFSTLLLINGMPNGDQIALDSARSFKLLADLEKGLEQDYSDPHSLDKQRFFNTICLVYGHRPQHYEYLIRNGTLPVERAFDCERDYARQRKSWLRLLAPHLVSKYGTQSFKIGDRGDNLSMP